MEKIIKMENLEDIFQNNFTFWDVDDKGNISKKDKKYEISCDRLLELNWLEHIIKKNKQTAEQEFYYVFMAALKNAGYSQITINLDEPFKLQATK